MIWTLVEVPFCGPHTTVKSSPGSHWKSDGECSPSTTNTTLKRSDSSTILCTSTRMVGSAHRLRAESNPAMTATTFLIRYQFFSF